MRKIIDLTHPIHDGMTTYPVHWHPMVEISIMGRHGIENRETRKLLLGSHTGTHLDAPRHFIPNGMTVDQLSLDTLIGPATIIDFSDLPEGAGIDIPLMRARLGEAVPERLLLRFDWHRHWGTAAFYQNHPYLELDTAEWLVAGGLKLILMDTPMPDNPAHGRDGEVDSPVHKIFLGRDVIIVEYLTNLDLITTNEVEIICLPLKVRDGDGSPVRCVAIEPEESE